MTRWTQRWLDLLDDGSPQIGRRFAQGRQLLRSGRATAVRAATGVVTGRVQGTHATPLAVEIGVATLDDGAWAAVADALGAQVRHRARLLAGQVPEGLEAQLLAAGVALFPERSELDPTCGCRDTVEPCAHVAAVWLAAAEMVDDDPFVLLRIRGRGRDRLLAETAAARSGPATRAGVSVPLQGLDGDHWTSAAGDISELELSLTPQPLTVAGQLRLLGDPPVWAGAQPATDLFGPLVRRGALWARGLADPEASGELDPTAPSHDSAAPQPAETPD